MAQKHQEQNSSPPQNDHNEHHRMMIRDFKQRFWVTLVLTIPILLLSKTIQGFFGFAIEFTGRGYTIFGLSTLVFFYGGWPFLTGLYDELKQKQPGMMTLIGLAVIVAYGYSSAVVFGLPGATFFWELATLILIMLLGHWIEMRSILGASSALEKLAAMLPDEAHLVQEDGSIVDVPVNKLENGHLIQIKPGEKIPADGTIDQGQSSVNQSMLTGESQPVEKGIGDEVIGGAINDRGTIMIRIAKTGNEIYLNKVITMVREAQEGQSKTQRLADAAALWLTITAISVGVVTLFTWLSVGKPFIFALERMVTVMVITCPHALGLAIPLVAAISTSVAAGNGLLIRDRTAFENARNITAIVFDKTGTLTMGTFGVTRYGSLQENRDSQEILRLASSLEQNSEHPIASGILKKAEADGVVVPEADNFESITGKGVQANVEGRQVMVVSPKYLDGAQVGTEQKVQPKRLESLVYVLVDGEVAGFIALADKIRKSSKEAIRQLKAGNINIYMLTGDNKEVAEDVSKSLNIHGYFAEVLPHDKQNKVKELQSKGEVVAMAGDGVNDAPALAQADIGIAVGSGTDIAAETADIILVESDPKDIKNLLYFGKATYQKMVQNLFWASGYNVIAIPLAAGVMYTWGIMISPAVGAVLMSLSTVIVAINAQLLKRKMAFG